MVIIIIFMVKFKLIWLGFLNQIGQSNLKSNDKFGMQIWSDSQHNNQIGFRLNNDVDQSQILIQIGLYSVKFKQLLIAID